MANPTTTFVHADVGIAWNHIVGTTTTIVKRHIVRAQLRVKNITGTTTGASHDQAIRALADAFTVQAAMASLDPNKANSLFRDMRDQFVIECNQSLQII